jgi:hypothetical protein
MEQGMGSVVAPKGLCLSGPKNLIQLSATWFGKPYAGRKAAVFCPKMLQYFASGKLGSWHYIAMARATNPRLLTRSPHCDTVARPLNLSSKKNASGTKN